MSNNENRKKLYSFSGEDMTAKFNSLHSQTNNINWTVKYEQYNHIKIKNTIFKFHFKKNLRFNKPEIHLFLY